jgi:hypothetical protein
MWDLGSDTATSNLVDESIYLFLSIGRWRNKYQRHLKLMHSQKVDFAHYVSILGALKMFS